MLCCLLLWSLLLGAVLEARASALAPETGMADDRVLLAGGPTADAAVSAWTGLGVDVVRIHVLWSRIAPGAGATRAPRGFRASDPNDPHYSWAATDAAVDRVRGAGIRVMLTITGPGPLWSSGAPGRRQPRYRPSAVQFGRFAEAVARRYGDRVDRYIVWNEPNQPGWLQPQSTCAGHVCTPAAPAIYRHLVLAAEPAIKRGDPGAQVLIGALAPRGHSAKDPEAQLRPLTFLRWFGCVTKTFKPVRSGTCRHFAPAVGDGLAFHPHGVLSAPSAFPADPDDVNFASLPHLESTLDRIQRAGGVRAGGRNPYERLDLYLDEFGYQTNPPDHISGVSAAKQDRWLQEAAYRAWRDPRVRNLTQYEWQDEPVIKGGSGGWQSGLRYLSGAPKPAPGALRHPVLHRPRPATALGPDPTRHRVADR